MINQINFASKLVLLMKQKKVSTVELSSKTNIAEITINKLRTGKHTNPTISTVIAIASFFKVSIDFLLNDDTSDVHGIISYIGIDKMQISKEVVHLYPFIKNVTFVVRVTNDNYQEYPNNSILLFKTYSEYKNNDVILLNMDKNNILCRLIIVGNTYIGRSMHLLDKYYEISSVESILGTVIGILYE